jgi:fibronectin-binding autotransporter adhesin
VTINPIFGGIWMTGSIGQNVTISAGGSGSLQMNASTINGTAGLGILIDNSNAYTLTISAPLKVGNTESWTNNSGNLFTVAAGGVNTNSKALTINGSGNTTISGVVSSSGAITKAGNGTLTLSNTGDTYTGQLTVQAGTLCIDTINNASANGELGNNALSVILGNTGAVTGTLEYSGGTASSTKKFTMATGGSGAFQVDTAGTTLTLSGVIDGSGALSKTGAGTLTLTGANTYSGGTNINAGPLNVGSSGAIGSSGTISFGGGTLQFSASNTTDYSTRFSTASNQAYSIDTNSQNVTFASALTSSGGTLTKLGSGTLTLSGVNTYTGGTTINAGTLQLGNANTSSGGALGTTTGASVTFGAGSTGKLQLNGNATTIIDLNTNATVGTPIIENGSSTATAVLTVNTASTDTYAGLLQDGSSKSLGLTKSGSGTLILTGLTNSQTGITIINGGILRASDITTYAAGNQNITSSILGQAPNNGVAFGGNNATLQLRYNGQSDSTSQTLTLATTKGGALLVNASAPNATIDVDRQGGSGTNKTIAFTSSTIATSSTLNITGADGYGLSLGNLVVGSGGTAGNATVNPTTANLTIGTATSSGTTTNHTLVLDGTSSGNTITGAMADGGASSVLSVTKQNTSSWTLSGANTYTGATTINAGTLTAAAASGSALGSTSGITVNSGGTLLLGANDQINNSATMALAGGTFSKGNFSEGTASAAGVGALTLTASSHVDFGTGTVGILTFASLNASTFTLTIDNWTGNYNTVGSASTDRLIFDSDQTANLASFSFTGYTGPAVEFALGGGFYEVVPLVPEPSTWISGALLLGALAYFHARRRGFCSWRR